VEGGLCRLSWRGESLVGRRVSADGRVHAGELKLISYGTAIVTGALGSGEEKGARGRDVGVPSGPGTADG